MNYRLFGAVSGSPRIAYGQTYPQTASQVVTVSDSIGNVLMANGFTFISISGSTSQRPAASSAPQPACQGLHFYDENLGKIIVCDAALTWRDPATGNSV